MKAEVASALAEAVAAAVLGHGTITFIGPATIATTPPDPSSRIIFKCEDTGKFSMQGVPDALMPCAPHPNTSQKVYVYPTCSTQLSNTYMAGTHAQLYHQNQRLECPGCDFQANSGHTIRDHVHEIHATGSNVPLKQ